MILFRHADPRFPFLWEGAEQPPGRWHAPGTGPVHYLADTPNGAWAEFLRHEEITEPGSLEGIMQALWAIEVPPLRVAEPSLPQEELTGGVETYARCQEESLRIRSTGAEAMRAPSAALLPDGATGLRMDGGSQPGPPRNGEVLVVFGPQEDLIGWAATIAGRPDAELLGRVRPLSR